MEALNSTSTRTVSLVSRRRNSIPSCLLAVYPTYYMILKLTLNKRQSGDGVRSAPEVGGQRGGLAGCG